jgi:hypothetical protein
MRLLLLCLLPLVLRAGTVWRPFSADSPWNTPIPADARADPASAALIDDLAARGPWHINIKDWSIPVYFVDADRTPKHDVGDSRPGIHGAGFGFPRQIPIPDDAVASPPVGEHSDNHLSIIDRTKGLEWGLWAARKDATGRWFTGLGAVTDLNGTGVAPPWFDAERELDSHRARASGFPLVAGLIMVDEIRAGRIAHALCFAYDHCRTGLFVPPASTSQVAQLDAVDTRGIPMGGRIQLDPAWDVEHSGLSPAGKVIARALQEYGAYCGDYAGANVLYAENSPAAVAAWEGLLASGELAAVFTPDFIRRHFRVLDLGDLLPGQNFHLPPPYLLALTIGGHAARIDQGERTVTLPAGAAGPMMWRTHPKRTQLLFGTRSSAAPAGDPGAMKATELTLLAPDGSISTWRILHQGTAPQPSR